MDKNWIDTALLAAIEGSKAIMQIYARDFQVDYKLDNSPVTEADKASSNIILSHLKKTKIPIISEEEKIPEFSVRNQSEFVWVVDPLDGTKEFIRRNGEFCICIALIANTAPVFGIIASPTTEKILFGGKETGVYYTDFDTKNPMQASNQIKHLPENEHKTVAYSRSHLSPKAEAFVKSLEEKYGEVDIIRKGSALKFIDLVLGKADFYPRLAPTMEWDIAAGQAIYEAVGGEVLDFTNFTPLTYNKEDLYNPTFIAKNKDLTL